MQSVFQYRRIGDSVKRQLERDGEKAQALVGRHIRPLNSDNDNSTSETPARVIAQQYQQQQQQQQRHDEENIATHDHATGEEYENENGNDGDSFQPEALHTLSTTRTRYSERTALGYSLTGVDARARATNEGEAGYVFVVGWEGDNDPLKPHNWSMAKRVSATAVVGLIAVAGTAASSIDAAVLPQYSAYWGISEVAGTLATAMYLFGFAIGYVCEASDLEGAGMSLGVR